MKKLLNATLLLILMLACATPALAQEGHERPGQVIFGSDLRLEPGDVVKGDVVIFGGSLRMAEGSRIQGDAVVFGGSGEVGGEIEGDLAFIGGSVKLRPSARIEGDVISVGGEVDVDEDAYVRGDIIEAARLDFGQIPLPPIRPIPPQLDFNRSFRFEPVNQFFSILLAFARGLVAALVVSAIGLLVVLFLPEHTQTVGQTISLAAPASFGVGLLTLIVGITLMTLLLITCCLTPVGLLLALVLILATLFGWIVVGYQLGQQMLRSLQKDKAEPTPVASAVVGIFVVTLVQQGLMALSHTPCLGFFFWLLGAGLWLLIASAGLGAVVLTRFGTQAYTGSPPTPTPPSPLPSTPPSEPAELESPSAAGSQLVDEPTKTKPAGEADT